MRLFVAAYPPPEVAAGLVRAVSAIGEIPAHRIVAAEQIHLTLQFIGEVNPKRLDELIESVERSCSGLRAFTLSPQRLITLPERGRARLIALETDAPGDLLELHRRLALRLARTIRRNAADRFLPHLTVCRFRPPAEFQLTDDSAAQDLPPPFEVAECLLMRSILRSQGAEHRIVERFALRTG